MLFEVCGRKSDIGFNDDPDVFMGYHKASCNAFDAFAKQSSLDPTDAVICLEGLERM